MDEDRRSLRAVAHPLRLRMLSMLTGRSLSAAELARELDITHANASYHLRVLLAAGKLVVDGEEKIRGGVAKRYRYRLEEPGGPPAGGPRPEDVLAWSEALHSEVLRRLQHRRPGPHGASADIETWVTPEVWRQALDLIGRGTMLLHEEARPPGTNGTIHVSATTQAFEMDGPGA
jgi:DNA-binding transcriptional ArsR family regulator